MDALYGCPKHRQDRGRQVDLNQVKRVRRLALGACGMASRMQGMHSGRRRKTVLPPVVFWRRATPQLACLYSRQSHLGTITENRRSEEHTSELQSPCNLVCRLLLEKKQIIAEHRNDLVATYERT